MSAAAGIVEDRFKRARRVTDYQALYAVCREYRPLDADAVLQCGSRLDRPWIPNPLVRMVRSALRGKSR
jgi:hypothetical protein